MKIFAILLIFFLPTLAIAAEEEKETNVKKGIKYDDVDEMSKRAKGFQRTSDYVHTWIRFPNAKGPGLSGGTKIAKARKGYVTVLFFIASWNVKSQELISKLKGLEEKYSPLHTDFLYLFSHDTFQDANAFSKEFNISGGMLAEHDINKAFHNPKVPSVYVADRHGWLAHRLIDVDAKSIAELDAYLEKVTVL